MQSVTVQPQSVIKPRWRWLWPGLALVPVGYYFIVLVWFAYNMPYMDDYPVLVDFLNKLPNASFSETCRLLLAQNNFHRVVWVKAISWLAYSLTGHVNFVFLQLLGNAALLLTTWILYKVTRLSDRINAGKLALAFLPVLFFIFQFQSWNNAFWAMAAMSNLWAPAWALLAFWLVSRQRSGWALLIGLLALLTNGNGILVLPLLLASFLLQQNWRWSLLTVGSMIPAFSLYFWEYSNPSGVTVAVLFASMGHLLALDTAFLGAMFYHPAVGWLPQLIGWATIGWTIYLFLKRYDRSNPTLFWMLVFLQFTGLMLAINRISNPVEAVFASRYKNITALVVALSYLTIADVLAVNAPSLRRWFSAVSLAVAVAICVVSNVTYFSKIVRFRELKQTDQLLWERYAIIRGCSPLYNPAQRLTQLARAGIFQPHAFALHDLASQPVTITQPAPSANQLSYQVDLSKRDGRFLIISGFAKIDGQKANFNDTFLAVQSPTGWRFFTTLFHQRLDNEDSLNDKDTGFTAIIPASLVSPATRFGLFVKSGGKTSFQEL